MPVLEGVAYRSERMWGVLAIGTVLAVMGLIDDRRNLDSDGFCGAAPKDEQSDKKRHAFAVQVAQE